MAHLNFDETYQYLLMRLIPEVCYAIALTVLPSTVCKKMNTLIDTVVIPWLGLNIHTPKAILYGPLEMVGFNYPQFETIQTSNSITYMIK